MQLVQKYKSKDYLLGNEKQLGEIPSTKRIYKNYFDIAWPAGIEGLFMMLISSVDLAMVGSLGSSAISATGIISQPRMMILCLSRSIGVAVTAYVARRYGEGKVKNGSKCMKQTLLLTLIFSLLILFLTLKYTKNVMYIAGANEQYIDLATVYGKYVFVGIFFTALGVIINSALVGVGNTKVIMNSNIAGNIVNVVLNYLLIYGIGIFPKLGVEGAGIATMIGNIVTFLWSFIYVLGKREITLRGKEGWLFDKNFISQIMGISGSAFLEQIAERIGMFAYTVMVAKIGVVEYAVHIVIMNINDIFYNCILGFGKASSALTGQSMGSKRIDMAVIYAKVGRILGFLVATFFAVVFIIWRKSILELFSFKGEALILGSNIMIIMALACFVMVYAMINAGVLRGAGDTKYLAIYSIGVIAIFRPILTWILCFVLGMGVYGAWITIIMDQSLRSYFSNRRLKNNKWKYIQI